MRLCAAHRSVRHIAVVWPVPELVRRAQEEDESVVRGLFQVRVRPWRVALIG
jgi:hypothetical protein